MMNQYAIDQYFKTVKITSFEGSLQSLVQTISRSTGIQLSIQDLLTYFQNSDALYHHCIHVYFSNGEINISIQEEIP